MNKKRIAKEWLIFLVAAVIGIAIAPAITYIFAANFARRSFEFTMGQVYVEMLFNEKGILILPIASYLIVSLVRSIIWAFKSIKQDNE